MQLMQKLAAGVDTVQAYHAVLRQPELWDNGTLTLRAGGVNWFNFDLLPQLRQFVFGIMSRIEGEVLGDVKLYRLGAGMQIELDCKESFELYVLPLNVVPGVALRVDAESVMILPGDLWWISSRVPAQLTNNSADDFVALLVQAAPNSPATFVPEPKL